MDNNSYNEIFHHHPISAVVGHTAHSRQPLKPYIKRERLNAGTDTACGFNHIWASFSLLIGV